jgi:hypothetical protein
MLDIYICFIILFHSLVCVDCLVMGILSGLYMSSHARRARIDICCAFSDYVYIYIYIYIYISKSRIVLRLLSLCDLVKSKEKIESKQYMHREFMWFHLRSTHSTYIAFILETNVTTSFRIRTTISNKIMLCMQAL